jgi:hypothetical protein
MTNSVSRIDLTETQARALAVFHGRIASARADLDAAAEAYHLALAVVGIADPSTVVSGSLGGDDSHLRVQKAESGDGE